MSERPQAHRERGPSHACPFCSAGNPTSWGTVTGLRTYECSDCGVVFFPRPIDKPVDYDEYYPYLRSFDPARYEWELSLRRAKYRAQLRVIRRWSPEARRLLDVGAGPGYLCRVALDEGWNAMGVETSKPAIEAGRKQFGVPYIRMEAVPERSQDVVVCHHVIEHIEEPRTFLRLVRGKLRDAGVLVVHVPHREPLSFMVRNLLPGRSGATAERRCQLYYPEHINGFTIQSLVKALGRFGFRPLRVRTVSMWSRHYDPFFLRNYFYGVQGERLPLSNLSRLARHTVRCLIDGLGTTLGSGDWVVAHFRAD